MLTAELFSCFFDMVISVFC